MDFDYFNTVQEVADFLKIQLDANKDKTQSRLTQADLAYYAFASLNTEMGRKFIKQNPSFRHAVQMKLREFKSKREDFKLLFPGTDISTYYVLISYIGRCQQKQVKIGV